MHRFVLHNRELRDAREATISPGQVGFLNGWGVFSTLRVSQGVLFAFERHYARLRRDAQLLRVPFNFAPEELKLALLSLVDANQAFDAVLRVAIVRNKGGLFESPGLTRDCDLLAFTANIADWGESVRLACVPNARFGASPFSGAKTTSWAQNLTWYEQAHERGFDEVILLNEHSRVSECTSANIFVVYGSDVWTPPLSTSGCLPGVTRAILLEDIHVPGVTIREKELTLSELQESDTVFITSTTRDLLPVASIDGLPLKATCHTLSLLRDAFATYRKTYNQKPDISPSLVSS